MSIASCTARQTQRENASSRRYVWQRKASEMNDRSYTDSAEYRAWELRNDPELEPAKDRYVIFPPVQEPGTVSVTINPLECILMAEHSARIEAERKLAEWKVAESERKAMEAALVAKRKAQRLKIVNCGRAMLVYFSILALAVLLALLIVRVA